MKKNRALVMVLLATAALGFMGCPSPDSPSPDSTSTYTGTVKVKIFNKADMPLTVNAIAEYYSLSASYRQGDTISVNDSKEFEISCSCDYHTQTVGTEIACVCYPNSSIIFPYAGYINGTSVTIYTSDSVKREAIKYRFSHPPLELKSSNPDTITVVYNFVKTTGGDYVLCMVE